MKADRTAAVYLRSSKDRHDVSIAAQRRELHELARSRGLTIVAEFADPVERANTDDRPGFQAMLRAMRDRNRPWSTILLLDTSRLFRGRFGAQLFKHEAQKLGVSILYAKVPDLDPITRVMVEAMLEAFDEVHSLMSRDKGLAGMRENVRQGFRAGGRAPLGYRLVPVETGATREGRPVTKTRLEPSADAPRVRRYLRARLAGTPREQAAREALPEVSRSTLVCMEWNALVYAGATVWNVHAPRTKGGYVNGRKRRPRQEWHVQPDTHEALITMDEAERLIAALEASDIRRAVSLARSAASEYLLTGLLVTPAGAHWTGHVSGGERAYRARRTATTPGRYVNAERLERLVTETVARDLQSDRFVRALTRQARRAAASAQDPVADLRRELVALTGQVSRAMDAALLLEDPAPALRKVDELERRRRDLSREIERSDAEQAATRALREIDEATVRRILAERGAELAGDKAAAKATLRALISQVVVDPETLRVDLHYRIVVAPDRRSVASPGVHAGLPVIAARRRAPGLGAA